MKRGPKFEDNMPSSKRQHYTSKEDTPSPLLPVFDNTLTMDKIVSYLDYQDLVSFDRIAREPHQIFIDNPQWWKPYLKQLKKIDSNISIVRPENAPPNWHYLSFKEHFARLAANQQQEVEHFKHRQEEPSFSDATLVQELQQITQPVKSIEALMQRDQFLNKLNINLIKQKINMQTPQLELTSMGLTRFPSELIEDESLSDYWQNLEGLYCEGNQLQALPESIGKLQALILLVAKNNQLQVLPTSIGQLQALQVLELDRNQLQTLPESIATLQALQLLAVNNNQLQTLPESIEQLLRLKVLCCADNRLRGFPESIEKLPNLQNLHCYRNELLSLPASLIEKLGKDWHQLALLNQYSQDFFARLKAIDPNISLIDPQNTTYNLQYSCKEQFDHLAADQQKEIEHFKTHKFPSFLVIPREQKKLKYMSPVVNMEDLIERHQFLNKLNINLIKQNINVQSTVLYVASMGLTRFPAELIEDNELRNYWQALQNLTLSGNLLKTLPESIGRLRALQGLWCNENCLQSLPEALKEKFGEDWCRQTLNNQKNEGTSQQPMLPLYNRTRDETASTPPANSPRPG